MKKQQVTLNDVEQLAAQLSIAFISQDDWLDLDTDPDALFSFVGMYRNSAEGIAMAYHDLMLYRQYLRRKQG
jgi:hypothetical protein